LSCIGLWSERRSAFLREFLFSSPAGYELAAAQRAHALAQCDLGILYNNGHGVEGDYKKAREYYELAAAQGNAKAQNNLGDLYYNGSGVERDYEKAKEY